ncbi:AAA family ATPase [Marinilactibacillus piezotolerans]|uniref:AAA family ATPase n=1 Tax=Marinilactibacillus piezotolerans TaxID=258723 RepID=UPI0009AF9507|nr:AAA family ATPase [Marinilactibacillus piezotolerans]
MELIFIVGPQAVGKMTVGKELEQRIDAKLLFNHETLDIFARFLGYTKETFRLSDWMRRELFKAFVENEETNQTKRIIFTLMVGFDLDSDIDYIQEVTDLFVHHGGKVYFVELEADVEERLIRNKSALRLQEKPSKRNLAFSEHELLTSMKKHRLNSDPYEVETKLNHLNYLRINNTALSPDEVAERIQRWID